MPQRCHDQNKVSAYHIEEAAENGQVHILEWAKESGLLPDRSDWEDFFLNGLDVSDLQTLELMKSEGCVCIDQLCGLAAANGYVELLESAIEDGASWEPYMAESAAEGGHLGVLQWANENDLDWKSPLLCTMAADQGHLHILKWARAMGCPWEPMAVCKYAAFSGHLRTLRWAIANGCEWNSSLCMWAVQLGI